MNYKTKYTHSYGINWIRFTDRETKEVIHLHRFENERGATKIPSLLNQSTDENASRLIG